MGITDGFYAETELSPQEYIEQMVGAQRMRSHFADWAAHNTAQLDYLTREQVARAYQEEDWVGNWDFVPSFRLVWTGSRNWRLDGTTCKFGCQRMGLQCVEHNHQCSGHLQVRTRRVRSGEPRRTRTF